MTKTVRHRKPTTPGEILREEFLGPLGMTQKQLADHLGCDVKVVNRIVNGRAAVTADGSPARRVPYRRHSRRESGR